jgi:hypothetical protein
MGNLRPLAPRSSEPFGSDEQFAHARRYLLLAFAGGVQVEPTALQPARRPSMRCSERGRRPAAPRNSAPARGTEQSRTSQWGLSVRMTSGIV